MTNKLPFISVVIPAYNEEHYIGRCLESLLKQDLDRKFFEVIVVDNASVDSTAKVIKKYPVRYIYEPVKSVLIARQRGADKSRSKIIVSADADTVYPENWLSTIHQHFIKYPDLICVVGWIYPSKKHALVNYTLNLSQYLNYLLNKLTGKVLLSFAANIAFKKKYLYKIGGYPFHLPQMGDQEYIVGKFSKLGKVLVVPRVYCQSDSRRYEKSNPLTTFVIYNIWYNMLGYTLNRIFGRQIIGSAPAVRTYSLKQ